MAAVRRTLATWPDIAVHRPKDGEPAARRHGGQGERQPGLFRVLLIIISTIIIALIIYTLTLDKIRDIALLKLIGARNSVIGGLILQQALLMARSDTDCMVDRPVCVSQVPAPRADRSLYLVSLVIIVVVISTLASLLGIWESHECGRVLSA